MGFCSFVGLVVCVYDVLVWVGFVLWVGCLLAVLLFAFGCIAASILWLLVCIWVLVQAGYCLQIDAFCGLGF